MQKIYIDKNGNLYDGHSTDVRGMVKCQLTDDGKAYPSYNLDGTPDTTDDLANAKSVKKAEMLKAYNTANEQNVDYLNAIFQADKGSQSLIIAVLSAGGVPDGFYWLDVNNNRIPMTYLELQNMSAALVMRGQINFSHLQDLKVLIDSKLKVSTVEVVSW